MRTLTGTLLVLILGIPDPARTDHIIIDPGETFAGVQSFYVVVGDLSDDAKWAGASRSNLERVSEAELRSSGLPVVAPEKANGETPYLSLRVEVKCVRKIDLCAYSLGSSFHQLVPLRGHGAFGGLWYDTWVGIARKNTLVSSVVKGLRKHILLHFIKAFRKANLTKAGAEGSRAPLRTE